MKKLFNRVGGGFLAGLALPLSLLATGVMALTIPATFSQRMFPTEQTHYIRWVANFNSCTIPIAGNCSFKFASIPYNSYLLRVSQQVTTAFNSTTTDTLAVGTATGGAQVVAAQSTHAGTAGLPLTVVAANLGIAATGNGIAQTGTNGGFDLWTTMASTGAAAPTQGVAVLVLEYIAPNDGACVFVSQGTTSPAC